MNSVTRSVLLPLAVACLTPLAGARASADAPAYHLVRSIVLTGADGWDYLTDDSRNQRLYVSRSTHVDIINTGTGKLVGSIPGTSGVHGIALDPKSGHGFTSNGRSNSVTIFNLKTLAKIAEVPVGSNPDAILYDSATQRVFTFNGGSNDATAIDAQTGKVIGTIPLGGRPEFAVADGKGMVYNNIEDKSEVAAINAKTLKVEHIWSIAPGDGPSGITMDIKGRRIFSVCGNQKMTVLDADTGKLVASPTIGNGPDAASFDAGAHLAFSSNGEDGTMTLLRQDSPNVYRAAATLTTQGGARTMTLDEKTHHLFTIAAKTEPPAAGVDQPRRRRYINGTVTVLEYAP